MYIIKIKYLLFLLFSPCLCFGQQNKNWQNKGALSVEASSIQLETFFSSIGYERTFSYKENFQFGASIGLGIANKINQNINFKPSLFPLRIYAAIGKEKHFLKFGSGWEVGDFEAILPKLFLGYKFQSKKTGFHFTIASLASVLSDPSLPPSWTERQPRVIVWGGLISVGKYFGQP